MKKIGDFVRSYKNASVVFKASIWFMAVTIIDKGISVLTQPVINRLLTVDEVGICGVYTSWYSIFSIFAINTKPYTLGNLLFLSKNKNGLLTFI